MPVLFWNTKRCIFYWLWKNIWEDLEIVVKLSVALWYLSTNQCIYRMISNFQQQWTTKNINCNLAFLYNCFILNCHEWWCWNQLRLLTLIFWVFNKPKNISKFNLSKDHFEHLPASDLLNTVHFVQKLTSANETIFKLIFCDGLTVTTWRSNIWFLYSWVYVT